MPRSIVLTQLMTWHGACAREKMDGNLWWINVDENLYALKHQIPDSPSETVCNASLLYTVLI